MREECPDKIGGVGHPFPTPEEEGGTVSDRIRLESGQEQESGVIWAACTVG